MTLVLHYKILSRKSNILVKFIISVVFDARCLSRNITIVTRNGKTSFRFL